MTVVRPYSPFIEISQNYVQVYNYGQYSYSNTLWKRYKVNNPNQCLFYYTGDIFFPYQKLYNFFSFFIQIQFYPQDPYIFFEKIYLIFQLQLTITVSLINQNRLTCTDQLSITMNGISVSYQTDSIYPQACYLNYYTTWAIKWDSFITERQNSFIIELSKGPSFTCALMSGQVIAPIDSHRILYFLSKLNQKQFKSITYKSIKNVLCPTLPYILDIEKCEECLNEQFRSLVGQQCKCKDGYYEYNFNPVCKSCKSSCLTCNNQTTCLSCFSNASLTSTGICKCDDGYFLNSLSKCQKCDEMCLTCYLSKSNCTSCVDIKQEIPTCACPNNMYFDPTPSVFSCQNCDINCATCEFNSLKSNNHQCTSCAEGQIDPPFCVQECSETEVYDYNLSACIPLLCEHQCSTCSKSSSNCLTCKGDRVKPPYCLCENYTTEDRISQNCIKCPEGQFFNVEINPTECQLCHYSCRHCKGSQEFDCLDCYGTDDFFLNSQGYCQCIGNFTLFQDYRNLQRPVCLGELHMSLNVYINDKFQQIFRVTFSDNLINVISQADVMANLSIYLQSTPASNYQIVINSYNFQYFEFFLTSTNVIPRQNLYVIALNQYKFQGVSNTILNYNQIKQPLSVNMIQEIVDNSGKIDNLIKLKSASESVQNNLFVQFVTNYYFFLFILSTLQPTILFLLISVELPLNVQLYLKIVGQFVFNKNKFFSWYQIASQPSNSNKFLIFNKDYSNELANFVPSNEQFEQIGFLENFFYNTQIPILLFLGFTLLHWVIVLYLQFDNTQLIKRYSNRTDITQTHFTNDQVTSVLELYQQRFDRFRQSNLKIMFPIPQQKSNLKTKKLRDTLKGVVLLLKKQLLSNIESNFINNLDQSLYINRYSIYMAVIFFFQASYSIGIALGFMQQKFYENIPIFTKHLNTKKGKYYFHFYSFVGKIIISLCIIFNSYNPKVMVSIIIVVQILQIGYIVILRPFQSLLYFFVKVIGTISYLIAWIALLCIIIKKSEFDLINNMKNEDALYLDKLGMIMLVAISIFNGVYLIYLIYDTIMFCCSKCKQILEESNYKEFTQDIYISNKSPIENKLLSQKNQKQETQIQIEIPQVIINEVQTIQEKYEQQNNTYSIKLPPDQEQNQSNLFFQSLNNLHLNPDNSVPELNKMEKLIIN